MRIFFVIPCMARGGAEIFLKDLSAHLARKGHAITLVSGGGELLGDVEKTIRTLTLPTLSKNILMTLQWIVSLRRKIKEKGADVICSNSILTAIIVYAAALGTGNVHKVLILHNPLRSWYFRVLRCFAHFGLEKIISVSDANRKMLMHLGMKGESVVHVPNAVDTERFSYAEGGPIGEKPAIGVIARMEEYKGHRYLVDAIRRIEEEENDISFEVYFCGDGSFRERLKEYVGSQSLRSNVVFKGNCTEVPAVLRMIDIFVLPSYVEAFPISILEAMSSGVPAIATRIGDIPEIIIDGETGLLVNPRDADSLKNALLRIIHNKELLQSIRKRARLLVEQRFSFDVVFSEYERIFKFLSPM